MKRLLIIITIILTFIVLISSESLALKKISCQIKETENGLDYVFIKGLTSHGKINIYLVKVDLEKYDIKLAMAQAQNENSEEKITHLDWLSEIAKKNNALSAINGTFYLLSYPFTPIGNIMVDGRMLYLQSLKRTSCIITKNKEVFFDILSPIKGVITIENNKNYFYLWGINRPRKTNEIIMYTPEYGRSSKTNSSGIEFIIRNNKVVEINRNGNSLIPKDGFVISTHGKSCHNIAKWLSLGTKINLNFNLGEWQEAEQIFTGGPRLLKNGQIVAKEFIRKENFSGYLLNLHSRSAIGLNIYKTKILLVVIDGYQNESIGVTYTELAHIMSDLGAIDAMALDGGSSSALWYKGKIINNPLAIRKISNAIVVLKKP